MRDVPPTAFRSRVKGRPALVRRLAALVLSVARFRTHWANATDARWAGRLLDDLHAALTRARAEEQDTP